MRISANAALSLLVWLLFWAQLLVSMCSLFLKEQYSAAVGTKETCRIDEKRSKQHMHIVMIDLSLNATKATHHTNIIY
jgi:hypothetical protein